MFRHKSVIHNNFLNNLFHNSKSLLLIRMSLGVMTLNPICEHVETAAGVPITVTGVAQVKVITSEDKLTVLACEQFLGKDVTYIQTVLLQTMEGHLRAILGWC